MQPFFKCLLYVCPTPGRKEYSKELKSQNWDRPMGNHKKRWKVPVVKRKKKKKSHGNNCFLFGVQESWLTLWRWYYHASPWRPAWVQRGRVIETKGLPGQRWEWERHGMEVPGQLAPFNSKTNRYTEDLLPSSSASTHPRPPLSSAGPPPLTLLALSTELCTCRLLRLPGSRASPAASSVPPSRKLVSAHPRLHRSYYARPLHFCFV